MKAVPALPSPRRSSRSQAEQLLDFLLHFKADPDQMREKNHVEAEDEAVDTKIGNPMSMSKKPWQHLTVILVVSKLPRLQRRKQ